MDNLDNVQKDCIIISSNTQYKITTQHYNFNDCKLYCHIEIETPYYHSFIDLSSKQLKFSVLKK